MTNIHRYVSSWRTEKPPFKVTGWGGAVGQMYFTWPSPSFSSESDHCFPVSPNPWRNMRVALCDAGASILYERPNCNVDISFPLAAFFFVNDSTGERKIKQRNTEWCDYYTYYDIWITRGEGKKNQNIWKLECFSITYQPNLSYHLIIF